MTQKLLELEKKFNRRFPDVPTGEPTKVKMTPKEFDEKRFKELAAELREMARDQTTLVEPKNLAN